MPCNKGMSALLPKHCPFAGTLTTVFKAPFGRPRILISDGIFIAFRVSAETVVLGSSLGKSVPGTSISLAGDDLVKCYSHETASTTPRTEGYLATSAWESGVRKVETIDVDVPSYTTVAVAAEWFLCNNAA